MAPAVWCPLRGHQTAGAHAGTNGHHRAHKWPNMGTMLIQPMGGQWCPRVGTGGLEPTNGHHGAHGGLKMCSAHGTRRGHRQPIVGTANPLPTYGHCSPLIASAALVPIVGCVELRMGTSVALAMGTRWFIFCAGVCSTQTDKEGARGTGDGVAWATQANIHPTLWSLYGLLHQASVLRPRAFKPEEA